MKEKTFEFRNKAKKKKILKVFSLFFLHIHRRIHEKVGCFNLTTFFVSNVVDIKGINLILSNIESYLNIYFKNI